MSFHVGNVSEKKKSKGEETDERKPGRLFSLPQRLGIGANLDLVLQMQWLISSKRDENATHYLPDISLSVVSKIP